MENGIEKAVRLAKSPSGQGKGQTALAKVVGVTPQAVQKWLEQGYVPGDRCRAIEEHFEGRVTRYELNPEVFGDAPASASIAANKPPIRSQDLISIEDATRRRNGGIRSAKVDSRKIRT